MSKIKSIDPSKISVPERMAILTAAVSPRPIAFAGTVDADGKPNLAPFSFYNAFGSNPPMLIFSPARRGRDNTLKDTFMNIKEVPEVVINAVSYKMTEQMNLASGEYPAGVNEYEKAGFTAIGSDKIKPLRVKESPVQFECKVVDIIETGEGGGAGNLVICEIVMIHVQESVFDENGKISPIHTDLIGRMGGDYYCRITEDSIFEVEKPLRNLGIGFAALPQHILDSKVLTGNELGQLASIEKMPTEEDVSSQSVKDELGEIKNMSQDELHQIASKLLKGGRRVFAMRVLQIGN